MSQLGSDCYIRVRDFGPGIQRRKLKKIFEKFYRIDDEMTRTTRGTGIGLALGKMLADAMDMSWFDMVPFASDLKTISEFED